jgi:hypothetical protein
MYHIDKFFKKELSVVLQPLDDEYAKFLASQKKEQDDFEREIEDLDEYFLNDNEMHKPVQNEPKIKSPTNNIDNNNTVKKHLEKTIKDFEGTL